jgi:hypothetical protein
MKGDDNNWGNLTKKGRKEEDSGKILIQKVKICKRSKNIGKESARGLDVCISRQGKK